MEQQISKKYSPQSTPARTTPREVHSLDRARCYVEPGNDLLEIEQIGGIVTGAVNQFG